MRPLLRSEHREAPRAAASGPIRAGLPALLALVDAWICAGRALLLEADYSESYARDGRWHDPLSGRIEPFERALARARRDAAGGRLAPFAQLVSRAEETLVRADGWAPTPCERGVLWREPDAEGDPRTLVEAAAVVIGRALRASKDPGAPPEGRAVVREGYDQRPEGQGDDVAQPPAPDDEAGPGWPDDGEGFAAVEGAWPARDGALGESLHAGDVAPAGAGALCR